MFEVGVRWGIIFKKKKGTSKLKCSRGRHPSEVTQTQTGLSQNVTGSTIKGLEQLNNRWQKFRIDSESKSSSSCCLRIQENYKLKRQFIEKKSVVWLLCRRQSKAISIPGRLCWETLGKIQAPLKRADEEKDRCSNLVICGLPEKKDIVLEAGVLEVLEHVDEKPRIISCFRMGRAASDGEPAIKPIRFTLSS